MKEMKLDATQEAGLAHLKEYLDNLCMITETAVDAGADPKIYNGLCENLKKVQDANKIGFGR